MIRAWFLSALALFAPRPVFSPSPSLPPLPFLPSIARVRIDAAKDHIVVVEEIDLPRGEWRSGDLDFYVAFGAPGAPQAFEARLLAVPDGGLEPVETDAGEPIAIDRAPRKPHSAQLLLGRPQMAGAVLHVKEPAFRRATTPGNMAAIRVRTLLALPPEDPEAGRELIVRLGVPGGVALTLGRLEIASLEPRPWITRAEANLCGESADAWPLAIALTPKPAPPSTPPAKGPIAPVLSVRHATDDLCVRFWTSRLPTVQ